MTPTPTPRLSFSHCAILLAFCILSVDGLYLEKCPCEGKDRASLEVNPPQTGVYLISMRVDPGDDPTSTSGETCSMSSKGLVCNTQTALYINNQPSTLSTGDHDIFGDVSAAILLNKTHDVLDFSHCCQLQKSHSLVYVVWLTSLQGHAFTRAIHNPRVYAEGDYVAFDEKLLNLNFPSNRDTFFLVPVSGIYWVTFRAHSNVTLAPGLAITLSVYADAEELMQASADYSNCGSGSAAFWLGHNSVLTVRPKGRVTVGVVSKTLSQSHSYLSVAMLSDNHQQQQKGPKYYAYTGLSDITGPLGTNRISFGDALTDYGEMYDNQARKVLIGTPGYYLVSLRVVPGPPGTVVNSLKLTVARGKTVLDMAELTQQGPVASAHTLAFRLKTGDEVYVQSVPLVYIMRLTMLSVALIQPDPQGK